MAKDPYSFYEAYLFSGYGGSNRPFLVEGEVRGSHWLEGAPDGTRRYVCDWVIDGAMPELVLRPRPTLSVGDVPGLPRVRAGADDVDRRVAAYSLATDLLRRLVEVEAVRGALIAPRAGLQIRTLEGGVCRACFERSVGQDVQSVGFENEPPREPGAPPVPGWVGARRIATVESRTVEGTAHGIDEARAIARALDALARTGGWRFASTYQPGVLDDDAVARLLQAVIASSSWLSGHAERVGHGVEARLTLPIGDLELHGTLRVRPLDERAVAATLQAELPDEDGDALVLSPEIGLLARLRALSEHEVGDRALDDALLIEGAALRLDDVRAAAAAIVELVPARPRLVLDRTRLTVELERASFDERLPERLGAALEAWDRVARRRRGLV